MSTSTTTDQQQTETDQQKYAPPAPTPADVAAQQARQQEQTTPPPDEGDAEKGRGSKEQVLADLARERDQRQAAETTATETAQRLDAVLQALGIKGDDAPDPEKLGTDLQAQRAENAVLRAGAGVADTDALLDSRAFTDSLGNVDINDRAAVKAHIEKYVETNPRFGLAPQTPAGVRDAAAGAAPSQTGGTTAQQFARWSDEQFG